MRILVVGDVHGDAAFFAGICDAANEKNCDRILQAGDYGYWEHVPDGKRFLDFCAVLLEEKNLTLYWLDGNHENHSLLVDKYGPGGYQHKMTDEGFWKIRDRLFYLPRGVRWNWAQIDFMAVGGASSIDRARRTPYASWWPQETLTDVDVEYASRPGNVDVMFTHDCPSGVNIPCLRGQRPDMFPESALNRMLLKQIVRAVKPKRLIHGHYHDRYDGVLTSYDQPDIKITGLACNLDPFHDTYVVLDTDNY